MRFKNSKFDEKLVPAKYLQRFFGLNSVESFAKYKLFPNIKEITESMSMWYAVTEKILPLIDSNRSMSNVYIIVCGDGHSPRTAGLFAHMSKAHCYSIDPQMSSKDYSKIKRLKVYRSTIDKFQLEIKDEDIAIILMPHSHAPIDETWDCVTGKNKWLVKMPCCTKDVLDWDPVIRFSDKYNMSAKNEIIIWNNK